MDRVARKISVSCPLGSLTAYVTQRENGWLTILAYPQTKKEKACLRMLRDICRKTNILAVISTDEDPQCASDLANGCSLTVTATSLPEFEKLIETASAIP